MITDINIEPARHSFENLSSRPKKDAKQLNTIIETIYDQVARDGDRALKDLTQQFDNCTVKEIQVAENEINNAGKNVSDELKSAIRRAKSNIEKFHTAQLSNTIDVEITEGLRCMQKSVAIERVGIYIPGGTAPLFSTVLMLAIPASLAGCKEIILCSPPDQAGNINNVILWTAQLCGVTHIYKLGGAQAIAAMTLGTATVPRVAKIFGPGNQYVTAAKSFAQHYGVAMDMPAGPSELLVYADETCVPRYVAADLLSQAEHGIDSQVILVANDTKFVDAINIEIDKQLQELPRREIAKEALVNSKAVVLNEVVSAFDFINEYAPEHFIIASETPERYIDKIVNAGSVFLGNYCPESAGDYASGTNHTLPTDGWSKSYNGVNVDSFSRKITFQSIDKRGILDLGDTIITMAENENLQAHANAVKIRLMDLENKGV